MKVILNSDILYDGRLIVDNLSKRLQTFLSACADKGHIIIVPQTTLLEFNRQQSELLAKTIRQLQEACGLLDKFKIPHDNFDPSQTVNQPNLIGLIKKQKVKVIVEEPTLQDFQEAHKRACLHECPHAPETKSDEMRDLVIWAIALRLAKKESNVMLISRDNIHIHERGDTEAKEAGLIRVKSPEDAEWYLDVDIATPAAILVKNILAPVWNDLLNQGLPLPSEISSLGISRASFVQGVRGPSSVICDIKAKTSDKKTFRAQTEIHTNNGMISKVNLFNITIDEQKWKDGALTIQPNKLWAKDTDDYEDRLGDLMQVLEEQA